MPEIRRGFSGEYCSTHCTNKNSKWNGGSRFLGPDVQGFRTFTPPDLSPTSFRILGSNRHLSSLTRRFSPLSGQRTNEAQTTGAPLDTSHIGTAATRDLPGQDTGVHKKLPHPTEEHIIITAGPQQGRGDSQKFEGGESHDAGDGARPRGNNAGIPPDDPSIRRPAFGDPDDGKGDDRPEISSQVERMLFADLIQRQSERTLGNQAYRNYLTNFASHNGIAVEFTDNDTSFTEEDSHAKLQLNPAQGSEGVRAAIAQITRNTFGEDREMELDELDDTALHRELETAILRNSAHTLIRKLGSNGWHEEARAALGLAEDERRSVRELFDDRIRLLRNIRETEPAHVIQAAELNYIAEVQGFVRRLPGIDAGGVNPARMVEEQNRSCAEASVIAGGLLQEAGVQYAGGRFPGHSFLVVRTADARVYHRDFIHPQADYELLNPYLQEDIDTGQRVTALDISSFISISESFTVKSQSTHALDLKTHILDHLVVIPVIL